MSFRIQYREGSTNPTLRSRVAPEITRWSERSVNRLWQTTESTRVPRFVGDAVRSPGVPLDQADRSIVEARFGCDFSQIRIHADDEAGKSAERLGAAAYVAGRDIVFARGQYGPRSAASRKLLTHELGHVVQQKNQSARRASIPEVMERVDTAEQDANFIANGRKTERRALRPARPAVVPSIASKILKMAEKQLAKRTIKTVSKHIALHARRVAGRALHSIFKNPREIRSLIMTAVREATEIAAKHAGAGTKQVIEEAGVRITRQATGTPGKFRLLIQKSFTRVIGTKGEQILRVVLDQTGRIVTAFPADRLLAIGLTTAGIAALTEGTARGGEIVQEQVAKAEASEKAREEKFDIWEWVPFIGDIWGGSLNEGEGEMIRQEKEITRLIDDTIADVEQAEQRTLGMAEREQLKEIIRAAIASPLIMEDTDVGEP